MLCDLQSCVYSFVLDPALQSHFNLARNSCIWRNRSGSQFITTRNILYWCCCGLLTLKLIERWAIDCLLYCLDPEYCLCVWLLPPNSTIKLIQWTSYQQFLFCNGSGLRMYRLSLNGFNTEKTSKRDDLRHVLASLFLSRFIYEPSVTIWENDILGKCESHLI